MAQFMYKIELRHDGLNKFQVIRGSDRYVVEQKAEALTRKWEEQWAKVQLAEERAQERQLAQQTKEASKEVAKAHTKQAQAELAAIGEVLRHTLKTNDTIKWDDLKSNDEFSVPRPRPLYEEIPPKPLATDKRFEVGQGLFSKLIPALRQKATQEAEERFARAIVDWNRRGSEINERNKDAQARYLRLQERWTQDRQDFYIRQHEANAAIDMQKDAYYRKEPQAVIDYCASVLSNSDYPDWIQSDFELDFKAETGMLVVDFTLPNLTAVPTLSEVQYVQSTDTFKEKHLKPKDVNELYDNLLYQITLRTIHELYEADVVEAIQAITFNGWVDSVDKSTGKNSRGCVLSLQASRVEFMAINLAQVDVKACFKKLKGVGSSQLHSMTPVAPIILVDHEDERFVPSYAVADSLDGATNLAAMNWEDFEHLIREVFEREFSAAGGEVKVTRASRDGGVDAVIFDPDPIRGGKIVIQAKRYTNTVTVSAVRDLYGTLVNEGATKGILITTADYGPDSYDFAKGKPLTLLNGSNLLHLLEKHGRKAKIDLKEAKRTLAAEAGQP